MLKNIVEFSSSPGIFPKGIATSTFRVPIPRIQALKDTESIATGLILEGETLKDFGNRMKGMEKICTARAYLLFCPAKERRSEH
jgi:hypothetical protein